MVFQELTDWLPQIHLTWTLLLLSAGVFWAASVVYLCFFHRYADVPGPFWAKISRFWLATQVLRGQVHKTQKCLHAKYDELTSTLVQSVDINLVQAPSCGLHPMKSPSLTRTLPK